MVKAIRCGRWLVMANTWSWWPGSITSIIEPAARQRLATFSTAASSVPGGGVRMHQRPSNSSGKPASGPECSVPAIGWPGTKCTPSGMKGPRSRRTERLDEPVSVTIMPGLSAGFMASPIRAKAPMGAATTTISDPATASAASAYTLSAIPRSRARWRWSGFMSQTARCPASFSRRITWAREEPIRPMPMMQIRLKAGSVMLCPQIHGALRAQPDCRHPGRW